VDVSLYHALNGLAGHGIWLDRMIRWVATWMSVAIGGVLVVTWFWPGSAEARGRRERLVIYAVASALIALGIAQVIGHVWFRDRPYVHHAAHLLLDISPDPSFPSDHAVGAFALAVPFLLARHRLGPWLLGMSVLLGLSRIVAGTHYPSDVIAGAFLGFSTAWFVWRLRNVVEPLLALSLGLAHRLRVA
jgi:undecaprenyl-diphosphatase